MGAPGALGPSETHGDAVRGHARGIKSVAGHRADNRGEGLSAESQVRAHILICLIPLPLLLKSGRAFTDAFYTEIKEASTLRQQP